MSSDKKKTQKKRLSLSDINRVFELISVYLLRKDRMMMKKSDGILQL